MASIAPVVNNDDNRLGWRWLVVNKSDKIDPRRNDQGNADAGQSVSAAGLRYQAGARRLDRSCFPDADRAWLGVRFACGAEVPQRARVRRQSCFRSGAAARSVPPGGEQDRGGNGSARRVEGGEGPCQG